MHLECSTASDCSLIQLLVGNELFNRNGGKRIHQWRTLGIRRLSFLRPIAPGSSSPASPCVARSTSGHGGVHDDIASAQMIVVGKRSTTTSAAAAYSVPRYRPIHGRQRPCPSGWSIRWVSSPGFLAIVVVPENHVGRFVMVAACPFAKCPTDEDEKEDPHGEPPAPSCRQMRVRIHNSFRWPPHSVPAVQPLFVVNQRAQHLKIGNQASISVTVTDRRHNRGPGPWRTRFFRPSLSALGSACATRSAFASAIASLL
jgi:hypothetical protein